MTILFGRPVEVVRAEFARKRLEQDSFFGVQDVVAQLNREFVSRVPADSFPWRNVLQKPFCVWDADCSTLELVKQLCTPNTDDETSRKAIGELQPLIDTLQKETSLVYTGSAGTVLVLTVQNAQSVGYVFSVGSWLRPTSVSLVNHSDEPNLHRNLLIDLLMTEWRLGRSQWEAVRLFLFILVDQATVEVSQKAETEFDQAVAVSKDLKRIVQADGVIVFSSRADIRPDRFYTSDVFRPNKITRVVPPMFISGSYQPGIHFKDDQTWRAFTMAQFLQEYSENASKFFMSKVHDDSADRQGCCARKNRWQTLIVCKDGNIFFTPIEHCPEVMPADFRELVIE